MIGVGGQDLAVASFGVGETTGLMMRNANAQVILYARIAEGLTLLELGIGSTLMAIHAPNLQERRLSTSRENDRAVPVAAAPSNRRSCANMRWQKFKMCYAAAVFWGAHASPPPIARSTSARGSRRKRSAAREIRVERH
jgi:hypothetical protein